MTGYESKKAMAQAKVEGPLHVVCQCDECKAQLAQEPVGKNAYVLEVNLPVGIHNLYTTPPKENT